MNTQKGGRDMEKIFLNVLLLFGVLIGIVVATITRWWHWIVGH